LKGTKRLSGRDLIRSLRLFPAEEKSGNESKQAAGPLSTNCFRAKAQRRKERPVNVDENQISKIVVDCCYRIHTKLGPGLLESVYLEILKYELKNAGLKYEKEVGIPVHYENVKLDLGFRADLIVENLVIVELKSVEKVQPVHKKQLTTYLKLTGLKLGLLFNFNVNLIKDGIERVVNRL
jgi:GxxExxY protein